MSAGIAGGKGSCTAHGQGGADHSLTARRSRSTSRLCAGGRAPLPGEYADGVQAVITLGKMKQGVRESVHEARRLTLSS